MSNRSPAPTHWSAALGSPLVWDQDQETAIRSPHFQEKVEEILGVPRYPVEEAEKEPETVLRAPTKTVVSRLNETKAAREPNYRWKGR